MSQEWKDWSTNIDCPHFQQMFTTVTTRESMGTSQENFAFSFPLFFSNLLVRSEGDVTVAIHKVPS